MKQKVLVTGGTGFLGSHVAEHFKKLGYDVYAIGRNKEKGKLLEEKGIHFLNIDFTQEKEIIEACKGMEYIIHAGALSSPWGKYEEFYRCNVVGTINIIKGAKKHGVKRIVHVSTPSLYFKFNDDEGFDGKGVKEDHPLPKEMVNDYAKTKWLAEQEIDKAFSKGLPVITIRPRAIFGEGDNALMPKLIAVNDKVGVPLFNGGKNKMDVTYVENVVHAIVLCLFTDEKNLGKKYNITNGETIEFHQLLEYCFKEMDKPFRKLQVPYGFLFILAGFMEWTHKHLFHYKEPKLTKYSVSVLAKTQTLNIQQAHLDLGYEPQISIREGIERYAKWYKEQEKKVD
ncbi:NAD-dependent epimerase/dehydratase family protein [Halalkalibacter nanhaiisediminis]|uniref:Nucleoside-diphosphate-sugar epimerase n=1 Tax=Halalkalibacter nanhaiisediminis TaxID=688079 RepID=A0A562QMV1_9BACI|nr:NAD(P)-dependent oxidoreductase [Halalkalibacter nanhaiisediminis]TWI58067.1 nucleoside-diphosphate-sugar epimerase [Halalkalibacter nanhaiisediminis]